MSFCGLEKITDKIVAEAQAQADKILADAQAECDRISADYAARAEQIRNAINEEAERNGRDYLSRAKSASANHKRNLFLQAQSDLIDEVFDSSLEQALALETEKYTELLAGLLSAAFAEQSEAERQARALASEDEQIEPDIYEVLMNARDRDRCGPAVLAEAKKKLLAKNLIKIPAEKLDKLMLSEKNVAIDGGLILRCGDVEANCSLSLVFAQLRDALESEVGHALFDVKKQN